MALPGLHGTELVGFTVPDLEEADAFLTDVIGCVRVYQLGPFAHQHDAWMREQLNVHPRSVMRKLYFYRCGSGANFEVFQWEAADTSPCRSSASR
jgi:catechol 2,3-dioxygenase-like lactoylglutathione lyase family enzyme